MRRAAIANHAAYIDHWLKILRGDARFLFAAAAHAQRAVDWPVAAADRDGAALGEDEGLDAGAMPSHDRRPESS